MKQRVAHSSISALSAYSSVRYSGQSAGPSPSRPNPTFLQHLAIDRSLVWDEGGIGSNAAHALCYLDRTRVRVSPWELCAPLRSHDSDIGFPMLRAIRRRRSRNLTESHGIPGRFRATRRRCSHCKGTTGRRWSVRNARGCWGQQRPG